MTLLRELLGRKKILLGDGAMGTLLIARGVPTDDCLERVNLERPELLEEIARAYFEAGSDLFETNTFGASPIKLAGNGLEKQVVEINREAVRAVRRVVGERGVIGGSVGPTGALMEPVGEVNPSDVYEGFLKQMEGLIDGGVDFICIETMADLAEATLALRAAREIKKTIPVSVTMTFDKTKRGYYTMMGVNAQTAGAELEKAGADLVGANCGLGIENMVEIARAYSEGCSLPVFVQPNAGMPEMREGKTVYPETPEVMSGRLGALLETGILVLGGCCGTTPDHIRAFRRILGPRVFE